MNARLTPSINGFPSGVNYKDQSVLYPGFGNFNSCTTDMTLSPGYVSTSTSYTGAWMACNGGERNDKVLAYYFAYHPDLSWVPAGATNIQTIPGPIVHNYNNYKLSYGRILVKGFYHLGNINSCYLRNIATLLYFRPR